jgi:hypothetical protein
MRQALSTHVFCRVHTAFSPVRAQPCIKERSSFSPVRGCVRACCLLCLLLQICEAFNANRYPFPEDPARQRQMHGEVHGREGCDAACCVGAAGCCLLVLFLGGKLGSSGGGKPACVCSWQFGSAFESRSAWQHNWLAQLWTQSKSQLPVAAWLCRRTHAADHVDTCCCASLIEGFL